MLNSLFIKNYRNFKHLEIPRLARVNLIGGKNNVGKTNLLEAVMLYVNKARPSLIIALLKKRDEYFDNIANLENSLCLFTYNHRKETLYDEGISIGDMSEFKKRTTIKLTKFLYEYSIDDSTGERVQRTREVRENDHKLYDYKAIKISNNYVLTLIPINKNFIDKTHTNDIDGGKIMFAMESFGFDNALEFWWDKISLTDKENKVIEILQLIEPQIEDLSFIKVAPNADRIPMVKMKGKIGKTSLRSLGHGMYSVLKIAIILVNCENKVCAIDEIATGLHYSVLISLWEMIFETAEKLNIQVFATTHSQDCIKAFAEVWNKKQSEGLYLRLQKNSNGQVVAVPYEGDILLHAADRQIEMR